MPAPRKIPTPHEVVAQQKADAERRTAEAKAAVKAVDAEVAAKLNVPAVAPSSTLPSVDTRSSREQFLDEVAPATTPGVRVSFDPKRSGFVRADNGELIDSDTDFILRAEETVISRLRFNGEGNPPTEHAGFLYDGFVLPPRTSLGDEDPAKWPLGLSGRPENPWLTRMYLVLQDPTSGEVITFVTNSLTGRRAAGNLLRHYDRLCRTHPGHLPVVKLKVGGFQHKDSRVGYVPVPSFSIVGRTPKDSAAIPDTSTEADLNDEVPW
jgi:hypothetical protein